MNVGRMLLDLGFVPPPVKTGLAAPALHGSKTHTTVYDSELGGHVSVPNCQIAKAEDQG